MADAVITITNPSGMVYKNNDYVFSFKITPPVPGEESKTYTMADTGALSAGRMFSYAPDMTKWDKIYKFKP
ncbi:hypothetical protein DCCM_0404 [Desulfocucumis palustris]|uniref:Uncharacterized protein n=1 Tax=Desulfocucumis palustris TaxID=1898651 RepID=A0A2L2X9E0_9FIRM|nr:hypothetical protein [Desulfocucumis palustris]GBF32213.1 hypothetical protein DCCM_0404 [Desulfocucumis palustris]